MFNQENGGKAMELQTEKEELLSYTASEVDSLLKAYEKYKSLASQIAGEVDPSTFSKFSFADNQGKMQNLDPKKGLKKELEKVGESMKFQNPLIWLRYKYIAYKDEVDGKGKSKFIKTVENLVDHCEEDGICCRRFDAINLYLRRKYDGKDMTSSAFMDPNMSLEDVGNDTRFINMCLDQEFMGTWSDHENSQSGKWREYELSSPDHDCEINCTC